MSPSAFSVNVPERLWDSEIDSYLTELALPLWQSAGFEKKPQFDLILSPDVNAYVTSDRTIHIYSGLIMNAESDAEVQGVLAHEIGHLMGRHHIRIATTAQDARVPTLIGSVIGVGAALAGAPQAGVAIAAGSQAAGISNILSYSRTQEREADQLGLTLLRKNELPVAPLLNFLDGMRGNQLLYSQVVPAYLTTHPALSERVTLLRQNLSEADRKKSSVQTQDFKFVKAKLTVFQNGPSSALRTLKGSEAHVLYGRAWAYMLQGKEQETLALIEKLKNTTEPHLFLKDLEAQLALMQGRYNDAADKMLAVLKEEPELPVTWLEIADIYLKSDQPTKALPYIEKLSHRWPQTPFILGLYGQAYGKQGKLAKSHRYLAEEQLIRGNYKQGLQHVAYAKTQQPTEKLASELKELENTLNELKKEAK
ncbi:MAG: M48 family metalloprotease [Pseudomonadota bacterium]|nr:M48 family metalloprotease [Pseudomonadota bacterium]